MLFRLMRQTCLAATFITLLTSCGGSKSEDSSSPRTQNPDRDNQSHQGSPNGTKICKDARIIKILDNGKSIISRLSNDRDKIIKWSLISGKKVSSLDFPVNPYEVSPDGRYIIRRINYKKYQLIKFGQKKGRYSKVITLNAAYDPMPKLEFSIDGEFLIINYRPFAQGDGQRIDIYSLEKEVFVSAINDRNITFAKVTRDSKYYLVALKKRYTTVVQKIDVMTSKVVYETNLNKYERFNHLYIGDSVFIVRGSSGHHAYDLETGEYLYSKKLKQLFDIGSDGIYGLVSENWNELKIMDLKSGEFLFKEKRPSGLILSSCQLHDSPIEVICQDSIDQGKILTWNIEQSSINTVCY